MSRTDKDMPWWVTATWYEPWHWHCEYDTRSRFVYKRMEDRTLVKISHDKQRTCDLPPVPTIKQYSPFRNLNCAWRPVWERHHYPGPSSKDRHFRWYGPSRAEVRDRCKETIKEYRSNIKILSIEPNRHHRHAGKKGWW